MLTAKENMRRVIKGEGYDRLVNQYEALSLCLTPYFFRSPLPQKGQMNVVNAWGVTNSFPSNTPGSFPVHTPETIVVKDIEHWQDYVKAPDIHFTDEEWGIAMGMFNSMDHEKSFVAPFIAPGLFEQVHHLCSIDQALINYMTNPEEVKDLINYIKDWELELAEGICSHMHPEAIFHHDDWGSEINSFLRPSMFEDFFVDAYKEIYGYYHSHGVELVVHHSDSYAANLVPAMIEMGIDVWQGCMKSNNIPELISQYGGKITFMGEIDNKQVDFTGWTQADCVKAVRTAVERCGDRYFIPCISQGGPGSLFDGTYMGLTEAIDELNIEKYGCTKEEIEANRPPISIMF